MHVWGWAIALIVSFVQPWGKVAADTKLDLAVDPAGFLARATQPYTDVFTLGQLQNQAYGYIFPQGAFFLATDFLPDWVAQRLWWTVVMGVGFSGFYELLRRLQVGTPYWNLLPALLYMLSPRTLTTLTAISSETWPVMLAPWVIVPLVGRANWPASLLAVAAMGAVNATATVAACVPAFIYVLARHRRAAVPWSIGCVVVSAWWLIPLFVLGQYSPPFTDFIESSYVTTRWLNPIEVLRGTTSWTPFVETERVAGTILATDPTFILITTAVAALGLLGLRNRSVWVAMLVVGLLIMSPLLTDFLDGPGAPLRNVHKFDPLVRIPLLVGFAQLTFSRRWLVGGLVAVLAMSPAWSARLLPQGAYTEIPDDWHQATAYVNEHADNTRTLLFPEATFARQDWGWTRDEPAQPLLDVPWAVRDAIPLVPPEAIRGLDGVMAVLHERPEAAEDVLTRLGIGAMIVRNDLEDQPYVDPHAFGGEVHEFGDVAVVRFHNLPSAVAPHEPVTVAGGGESLAVLDMLSGPQPRRLVAENADIVTDTPALTDRNYGTVHDASSAPLASVDEGTVRNRVPDYPSVGPRARVREFGGEVAVSSSESDATSFGGADPARSPTAAVDGHPRTAWWPSRGDAAPWLELRGEFRSPTLRLRTTEDVTITVRNGQAATDVEAKAGTTETVQVPGGNAAALRLELHSRAGVAEVEVEGSPIERVVAVPDSSPQVKQFLFQRLTLDTGTVIREFTAPRRMEVELASSGPVVLVDGVAHQPGERVTLDPGTHRVRSDATWVTLTEPGFAPSARYTPTDREVEPGEILVTGRATNPGLPGGSIDAAAQAVTEPGPTGFQGAGYRLWLGGAVSALAVGLCMWGSRRRWPEEAPVAATARPVLPGTTIPAPVLSAVTVGLAGVFLSHAPWPSAGYAGDSWLTTGLCVVAIAALVLPPSRNSAPPRE